jgi:hypothetical protein
MPEPAAGPPQFSRWILASSSVRWAKLHAQPNAVKIAILVKRLAIAIALVFAQAVCVVFGLGHFQG